MSRMVVGGEDFLLDGQPLRILSGAIHYFRVHPSHWSDRVRKARQLGLNTIETYVAWNLHAPRPEVWNTSGLLDLGGFLRTIEAEGMHAIVRPGPYICAEFAGGGLPAWLLADPHVGLRRCEPTYLAAVEQYLRRVTEIVAPLQVDNGGPVVLVQVENEYGAYGNEAGYLDAIAAMLRSGGITVPFTTVDQPNPDMLKAGTRPDLLATASFGSRSVERMRALRAHQPTGPLMSSEYWNGWFDSWGEYHHRTSAIDSAADLDELLSLGASVNLYMFHGGTNFALTNGANDRGVYQPIVTSYDYDAPLDEAGRPTEKYWAYREVIGQHTSLPAPPNARREPAPTGIVRLDRRRPLLPVLAALPAVTTDDVPTFEEVACDAAFLAHTTAFASTGRTVLTVGEVRDRVQVVVDGTCVGVLARDSRQRALTLPPVNAELTLFVEDQGRVNYGPRLGENKGVIGAVRIDGRDITGWQTRVLREADILVLADLDAAPLNESAAVESLTLAGGRFDVIDQRDRFLDTAELGKGIAWVNGFCLGRYWSRGPQRTLYVPGPVLHVGVNELVILELDTAPASAVRFMPDLDLGPTED